MHVLFMPYGKRTEVELLLRDMEAQKHLLVMNRPETKEQKFIWIQGQVRILPFGIYEYVFPKEDLDIVLNTLNMDADRYQLGGLKKWIIRKGIKCKEIPPYSKEKSYLWIKDNVNVVPIGIREDGEILDSLNGYNHEAI